ncbi:hypothetical protein GCK72_000460 [Caenorhabditis remanei]|uniref:K Homology domain-containing protein n=1 Tax=Caenorhabditis remanei TaxID=31234 RepID=A0A6A5HL77_CAERE|nr:hypothetical protein GCK72_000460 [Caenorhabditis remanei]KAF1768648.1 hypothetical protein GCK72_000460 [Caenorhabditis remanei]
MDEATLLSSAPQEVYIPQKLKAFMSEPQGSALVAALESQFQCIISVINDFLSVKSSIPGMQADLSQIENILRDVWQKRDIQLMIREAALNASCTHTCHTILPRAYCAVVFFFSSDIKRRSRCNDMIIDHFTGKVTMFGTEQSVNTAREVMIECLTEHFGLLEIEIPITRRTARMGYNSNAIEMPQNSFNPEVPPPQLPAVCHPPFLNNIFSISEPNAILTSTPASAPARDGSLLPFDNHLLFPSDFSVPPPQLQPVVEPPPKTNNVEKIKHWIPTAEVGKILGNRAAMKKQIEGQFNCVITVHTEVYSHFGMTSVEIMAQNKEQCRGARNAVMSLMSAYQEKAGGSSVNDSGVNSPVSPMTTESPSTTPEKRGGRQYHRSSFRDQPKVMLALTPRKIAPAVTE